MIMKQNIKSCYYVRMIYQKRNIKLKKNKKKSQENATTTTLKKPKPALPERSQ
jgi:hypothetical protein